MIKELSDPEEYDPLLDYAQDLFDQIHPDIDPWTNDLYQSQVPYRFQRRYANGDIDISRTRKYLDSIELQDTLRVFGIDKDMFWYLCLCIKDYIEDSTIDAPTVAPTPREDLKKLIDLFDSMNLEYQNGGYDVSASNQATLKLKVEGCKNSIEITNPIVFMSIKEAINAYLERKGSTPVLNMTPMDFDNTHTHAAIHKLYYFNEILGSFLEPLEASSSKDDPTDNKISRNKSLLISRMIFILGLSDNEDFYEEYNDNGEKKNYLKGMLRRYKPSKIHTVHNYYM